MELQWPLVGIPPFEHDMVDSESLTSNPSISNNVKGMKLC